MSDRGRLLSAVSSRPPAGGQAAEVKASDGLGIRVAYWPGEGRGTVVLFQGRTEFIEKYYEAIGRFIGLGFAVGALDWRGQGLSERPLSDRRKGHVRDFADYQRDADALIAHLEAVGAPRPWVLVGHSMGGAISARLLMRRGELFRAAMLSAPMLGLHGSRFFNGLARLLAQLRRSETYATGCDRRTAAEVGFDDNFLTTDMRRFGVYAEMVIAHDELALGGPSWGWLRAAYREMAQLRPTQIPMLIFIGDHDRVVSIRASERYLGGASDRELFVMRGARHEPFLEDDAAQTQLWDRIGDFLGVHAPARPDASGQASARISSA